MSILQNVLGVLNNVGVYASNIQYRAIFNDFVAYVRDFNYMSLVPSFSWIGMFILGAVLGWLIVVCIIVYLEEKHPYIDPNRRSKYDF